MKTASVRSIGYSLGSIVIIDCHQYHEYRTYKTESGNWTFYWLHFHSEYAGFYIQQIYHDTFYLLDAGSEPFHIFEEILKNLQYGDSESLLLLNDCVCKILAQMINSAKIEKLNRGVSFESKKIASDAAEYIKVNYWKPLALDHLAKQSGLSKFHFLRLFKTFTGMTPYRYLITERVNAAKKLLQTTDLKVSEISLMVGFADESNFIRTFKSISGLTPKAYRFKP